MVKTYNIARGLAVVFDCRYGAVSSDARFIDRVREKLIASGNPALEIIQDGVTTIGTAVTFASVADVPKGVEFYTLT